MNGRATGCWGVGFKLAVWCGERKSVSSGFVMLRCSDFAGVWFSGTSLHMLPSRGGPMTPPPSSLVLELDAIGIAWLERDPVLVKAVERLCSSLGG